MSESALDQILSHTSQPILDDLDPDTLAPPEIPPGTECVAIANYAAGTVGELDLQIGDPLVVVATDYRQEDEDYMESLNNPHRQSQDQGGLWDGFVRVVNRQLGPNNGKIGWVPVDYVDVVESVQSQPTGPNSLNNTLSRQPRPGQVQQIDRGISTASSSAAGDDQVHQQPPAAGTATRQSNMVTNGQSALQTSGTSVASNISYSDYIDEETTVPTLVRPHTQTHEDSADTDLIAEMEKRAKPGSKLVVRYPYESQKMDELDLAMDEVIVVTQTAPGGWWKVRSISSDSSFDLCFV